MGEYESYDGSLDATGMQVAIVAGRFNSHVTRPLLDGAMKELSELGLDADDVPVFWVPGAFEIPLTAKTFAIAGQVDAVVCIGCVIRGDTAHFDFVAGQCAQGIQQVGLETGFPVIFGVLTTEDLDQALCRSEEAGGHNVGEESARTAVEMAALLAQIRNG